MGWESPYAEHPETYALLWPTVGNALCRRTQCTYMCVGIHEHKHTHIQQSEVSGNSIYPGHVQYFQFLFYSVPLHIKIWTAPHLKDNYLQFENHWSGSLIGRRSTESRCGKGTDPTVGLYIHYHKSNWDWNSHFLRQPMPHLLSQLLDIFA